MGELSDAQVQVELYLAAFQRHADAGRYIHHTAMRKVTRLQSSLDAELQDGRGVECAFTYW